MRSKTFEAAMTCHYCGKVVSVIGGKMSPHKTKDQINCKGSGQEPIAKWDSNSTSQQVLAQNS